MLNVNIFLRGLQKHFKDIQAIVVVLALSMGNKFSEKTDWLIF